MATQPPANLPLFYKNLMPLSSSMHQAFKTRSTDRAPHFAETHAVPLTVEEFAMAQRFYPIVFSVGDNPVPLALFGLNEGVNVFMNEEGRLKQDVYVPAYVRRYPFMLARLQPDAQELSLCFDPTSDMIGAFDDGQSLFEGDKPSEATNSILKFCEEFEMSAQRTTAFIKELQDMELLMDGEVAIQLNDSDQPYIYRGFQMVSEEKLRDLRGDALRKMNQSGMLAVIFAHLLSLGLVREVFAKMLQAGKVPPPQPKAMGNA
jgi:hypothetical protein